MAAVSEKQTAVEALGVFAGRWHAEGPVHKSAYGPTSHWSSEEHYEWLPGGRFLVNRWDAEVGGKDFRGMAVLGHDEASGYFAAFYDNGGHAPVYSVSLCAAVWTFAGDEQRAFYSFRSDSMMRIRWEWRDSVGWHPLCDLVAKRVASAAEVVRDLFAAFEAQDRARADLLLDEDFTFSSPRDDRIDKRSYFERCWPNADKIRDFRLERVCEHDTEVFVRYSAERVADRVRFRNTELIRVARGRVKSVDVYFGREL